MARGKRNGVNHFVALKVFESGSSDIYMYSSSYPGFLTVGAFSVGVEARPLGSLDESSTTIMKIYNKDRVLYFEKKLIL